MDAKDASDIDDVELTCKDGVIMRTDSKKIRFSTAISFIEARRISIDILNSDDSILCSTPSSGPQQSQPSEVNHPAVNTKKATHSDVATESNKPSNDEGKNLNLTRNVFLPSVSPKRSIFW